MVTVAAAAASAQLLQTRATQSTDPALWLRGSFSKVSVSGDRGNSDQDRDMLLSCSHMGLRTVLMAQYLNLLRVTQLRW